MLYQIYLDPRKDTLFREVAEYYTDLSELENELHQAFKIVKYYYPEFTIPKVYTFVSGLAEGGDLYVSANGIYIGLDFFMGKHSRYAPNIANYILKRYQKPYIASHIMWRLSMEFINIDPKDGSLLADMINHAKAYEFVKSTLPHTPDSIILGYTPQQMLDINHNESTIWAHFIEKEVLYKNEDAVKRRYIGESPKTSVVGEKCPGRIGRWLGWEILREYKKRTGKKLPELMKEADAKKILTESKFRP